MSRWLQTNKQESSNDNSVSGTFECHTCYVYCHTAEHDAEKNTLTWICPDGHKSILKDFRS